MGRLSLILFAAVVALAALSVSSAVHIQEALVPADLAHFKSVFNGAVSKQADLASVHYGVLGLGLLKETTPNAPATCTFLQSKVDASKAESLYYAAVAAKRLSGCQLKADKAKETLTAVLATEGASAQDLFYASVAGLALGLPVDGAKLTSALQAALKKGNEPETLGYGFLAASHLQVETFPFLDRIEDAVAQADEVDGKILQFENGLAATAVVVSGIFKLSAAAKKAPAVQPEAVVKFANYFLSRKGAQQPRLAYAALAGIDALAGNEFFVPVAIRLVGSGAVSSAEPKVQVQITNIRGEPVPGLTAVVDTATLVASSGVVLSKKALSALSDGKFEFNFLEQKRERGFYKLTLSAQSTDTRLVGTKGEVTVKVLTEVTVEGVELSVVDREQASTSNIAKLQYPSKFATPLEADSHQKILMKFTLKDKATNTPVRVHQAFIAFSKVDTKQEIVFVAEPDSAKVYKFDVDLQKSSKDFDFLSGKYSMKMIVGDAVISNPFVWHLADINLKFAEQDKPKPSGKAVIYKPLPEIKHLFREPEKRPPGVVSDTFTILALVPLAVLLILWLRIGINFWNFSLSPASLGYHIGLGAIFGLYFMFWWKLNMFVTLKYLAGIGGVTFIAGNAMLRGMANRRKAKSE